MHTIVLDANILVSAFLTPEGESYAVVRQAQAQELYLSPFILSEVWRTLHAPRIRKKYHYPDAEIEHYITELASTSTLIEPTTAVEACMDPDDNAVLACAVAAHADYLVTRNTKHFREPHHGLTPVASGLDYKLRLPAVLLALVLNVLPYDIFVDSYRGYEISF